LWNSESAMLEISICMPLYCAVFLSFEILPLFLERLYYTGNDRARDVLRLIAPGIRKVYPFVIAEHVRARMSWGNVLSFHSNVNRIYARNSTSYFPSVPELVMAVGISLLEAWLLCFF